ncbi:MAG TPA: hypothetical protein VIL74_04375 [Pyrinomonadaceae bacterium]|jgi:hypothetical protein
MNESSLIGGLIFLLAVGLTALVTGKYFPRAAALFPGFEALRKSFRPAPKIHHSKLVGVLLTLDDEALEELFALYKKQFGAGAARYARKTHRKWKAGEVRPVRQTFERFLVHLPQVMSFDLKCEILRTFMEEFAAKDKYELKVHTDDWEEKLTPFVGQIIDKAYTAQLAPEVERKLRWLGDGDMQLAQDILRRSQAEEGRIVVSTLREEFARIEKLLGEKSFKPKVTHTLKFPYGTITLSIKRR